MTISAEAIQSLVLEGQVASIESQLASIDSQLSNVEAAIKELQQAKMKLMNNRVALIKVRNENLNTIENLVHARRNMLCETYTHDEVTNKWTQGFGPLH